MSKLLSHHRLAWPLLLTMREFGRPVHSTEVVQGVADRLELEPELVALPSGHGRRTLLEYRLGWARTLLKGMGAIEKVEPSVWAVTLQGESITEADVGAVTQAMLAHLTSTSRSYRTSGPS